MPKNIVLAVIRAVVAIAVVVVVFVTLVFSSDFERPRLSVLSVRSTGIAGMVAKPETASSTDVTTSPVATIKAAAKADPHHTGVYSSIWNGVDKSDLSVVLTIDVLPTAKLAAAAQSDTSKTFFSASAAKTYSKTVKFALPNLPNSVGADLYTPASSSAKAAQTEVALYRQNNIVVLAVFGGSINISRSALVGLANREYTVIKSQGPGFSMYVRGHPGGLSTLYFFGGALLIAFSFGGMYWIAEAKTKREAHKAALIRYHTASRGSKNLKRKAAPTRRR